MSSSAKRIGRVHSFRLTQNIRLKCGLIQEIIPFFAYCWPFFLSLFHADWSGCSVNTTAASTAISVFIFHQKKIHFTPFKIRAFFFCLIIFRKRVYLCRFRINVVCTSLCLSLRVQHTEMKWDEEWDFSSFNTKLCDFISCFFSRWVVVVIAKRLIEAKTLKHALVICRRIPML